MKKEETIWKEIDKKQLEEEWTTEQLDSLFFSGYPNHKQVKEVKDIFFEKLASFSKIETIPVSSIEKDLYGNNSSFEQLRESTSYMNKDIEFIKKSLETSAMPMPLMMRKNGELSILGGRTRCSVCRILNKEIKARVIDYSEMAKHFSKLRERDFLSDGYGLFSLESRKIRFKLLHAIKKGSAEAILGDISILSDFSPSEQQEELNCLKDYLFATDTTITRVNFSEETFCQVDETKKIDIQETIELLDSYQNLESKEQGENNSGYNTPLMSSKAKKSSPEPMSMP